MRRRYSLDLLLLLLEAREGEAEAAQPAVGGVDLGAGAGDGHPHRRMRLLVGLGQDGALGHRPEFALVGEGLLHPHLGQAAHELVPALLGGVGIGAEAAELGPGGRAAGADMQAAARQDVERRRPLGDLDRMVELGHADHDAVADLDVLGQHGAGGEEQLGRRAVRIFLEEVVLDGPHMIEAQLVGQLHLLEAVVVDGPLFLRRPRTRNGNLVEQAELHPAVSLCPSRNARLARGPAQQHHGIGGRNRNDTTGRQGGHRHRRGKRHGPRHGHALPGRWRQGRGGRSQ